jgi:hypothetical protein
MIRKQIMRSALEKIAAPVRSASRRKGTCGIGLIRALQILGAMQTIARRALTEPEHDGEKK